jgi:hypothetical protein
MTATLSLLGTVFQLVWGQTQVTYATPILSFLKWTEMFHPGTLLVCLVVYGDCRSLGLVAYQVSKSFIFQDVSHSVKGRDQWEWIGLWKVAINRHLVRIVVIDVLFYFNLVLTGLQHQYIGAVQGESKCSLHHAYSIKRCLFSQLE